MLTEQAKALGIHPSQKGIKDKVKDTVNQIIGKPDEPTVEHNTADESEGVTVTIDYDDMKMSELRKIADDIAKEKAIKPIRSTLKLDIINFIKANK
jgi:hypothetical protein